MKWMKFFCLILVGIGGFRCAQPERLSTPEMELQLPDVPYKYQVKGVTDQLPTLGRVLFYDPRLSLNNSVACASCHKQSLAFADNSSLSRGYENLVTVRNSMPIQNIVSTIFFFPDPPITPDPGFPITTDSSSAPGGYLPGVPADGAPSFLFWDGRENSLESMVTKPILNHIEMGMPDLEKLAEKLSRLPEYNPLFSNAFGKEEITSEKIALGLSAFLLSIRSNNSRFDKAFAGTQQSQLTAIEELGRQVFFEKYNCNQCHESHGFANIGLDVNSTDPGVGGISNDPRDLGKFKIPSLRNVQLTAPYMHDGRFLTLDDVLNHYSHNIQDSTNLDFRLQDQFGPKHFDISDSEKKAIIEFLNTLTDYEMVNDPKFSNPFRPKSQ